MPVCLSSIISSERRTIPFDLRSLLSSVLLFSPMRAKRISEKQKINEKVDLCEVHHSKQYNLEQLIYAKKNLPR